MGIKLVTLQQASDHLRRDTDADDNDLILKIEAASRAVLNYLKVDGMAFLELDSAGDVELDSAGDALGVPEEVKAATLLLLSSFYSDRSGQSSGFRMGYLPEPVTALLYPLRKPAME
jgi:hypothetical protein